MVLAAAAAAAVTALPPSLSLILPCDTGQGREKKGNERECGREEGLVMRMEGITCCRPGRRRLLSLFFPLLLLLHPFHEA
jgi:hypothetical protein